MKVSNIYEAKTRLSEIVASVAKGEKWAIAKNGVIQAVLIPALPKSKKIKLGAFKGKIKISDDFDAPMSEQEVADWSADIFPKLR